MAGDRGEGATDAAFHNAIEAVERTDREEAFNKTAPIGLCRATRLSAMLLAPCRWRRRPPGSAISACERFLVTEALPRGPALIAVCPFIFRLFRATNLPRSADPILIFVFICSFSWRRCSSTRRSAMAYTHVGRA